MFVIPLRWGRRTPGPTVQWPLDAVVLVFVGVLVLAVVHGWGAILVGFGFLAVGGGRLTTLPPDSSATGRTDGTPTVP